jgi:AcrR family transcriptional regulator
MATSERRPRNPQGEGARLRDELITAAGRLLEAGTDLDTLSLRGVAREAGVAAPSVYLHFASKDALLREVRQAHFESLRRAIELASATVQDPAAELFAGSLAYCRYAVEHPGSYRILFETPHATSRLEEFSGSRGEAAFRTLVDGVAECIAAGIARPGDPFRIACDIWPALHGIASLRRTATGFPWPPLEDQVRGILEAFTGIPYGTQSAVEETTRDRTT